MTISVFSNIQRLHVSYTKCFKRKFSWRKKNEVNKVTGSILNNKEIKKKKNRLIRHNLNFLNKIGHFLQGYLTQINNHLFFKKVVG